MPDRGKNWIGKAIERPGALRAKAKARGLVKGDQPLSQHALNTLAETGDTRTKKQVVLAKTLKKMGK